MKMGTFLNRLWAIVQCDCKDPRAMLARLVGSAKMLMGLELGAVCL